MFIISHNTFPLSFEQSHQEKGNCKIVSLSLTTAMEFWRRKKEKGKARKWFLRNGSMFLEQLIADCNGMSNPIRVFCTSKHVKDLQERGEPVEFGGGSNDMRPGQMRMCLDLALRCCEERNEDRPKMTLVAKDIKLIEQASI